MLAGAAQNRQIATNGGHAHVQGSGQVLHTGQGPLRGSFRHHAPQARSPLLRSGQLGVGRLGDGQDHLHHVSIPKRPAESRRRSRKPNGHQGRLGASPGRRDGPVLGNAFDGSALLFLSEVGQRLEQAAVRLGQQAAGLLRLAGPVHSLVAPQAHQVTLLHSLEVFGGQAAGQRQCLPFLSDGQKGWDTERPDADQEVGQPEIGTHGLGPLDQNEGF